MSGRPPGAPAGRPRRSSYRRLKPHPGSAGESVVSHQLARMRAATIDVVAEAGHEGLTVAAITRAAGVSKRSFYQRFADKDACFLATYDLIVREMTRCVLQAQAADADWRERLRLGYAAVAREIADNPRAARLALIDIFVELPGAAERLRHNTGLLEGLVHRTFALAGDGLELPAPIYRAIVGGSAGVARARLLRDRTDELPGEALELMGWALSLRDVAALAAFAAPPAPVAALASAPTPPAAPIRLPVGASSRREGEAVLAAAAEMYVEEGYEELTVDRVRRRLGLSRARVEPHWPSREECVLAALEVRGRPAIAEVRASMSSQDDWPAAVVAGLAVLCSRLEADPTFARLALLDVFRSGLLATDWRASKVRGLAALLRATAPAQLRPTRLQAEASVAGAWAILAAAAEKGAPDGLRPLAPGLAYVLLAPVMGGAAATAAVRAGVASLRRPARVAVFLGDGCFTAAAGPHEREPVPGC